MKPRDVYQRVLDLNLSRIPEFDELSEDEFENIYNGCGPDSWSDESRARMTWIFRYFEPLLAVHDVEFHFSNGTEAGWERTQKDWDENIPIVLNDVWPVRKFWLIPRRIWGWAKIRGAYKALDLFSLQFYIDAAKIAVDRIATL